MLRRLVIGCPIRGGDGLGKVLSGSIELLKKGLILHVRRGRDEVYDLYVLTMNNSLISPTAKQVRTRKSVPSDKPVALITIPKAVL